ncbi:PREDICTED: secernin-3 [Nanorana parkeri]|uniref:secernin-3 n=1 Tax=Nanorana parkeri TaxID=125878 RepID=UPI00085445AB|nr:PREDICTED: secernin-3 [Nanorana parkeri]
MEPCSCDTFVALPPATVGARIIFGKNSDRPSDEVQEIVYFPGRTYGAGEKLESTYIKIDQVEKTHAVVLSRPSWLWGAEMGANEFGVCIGNEAVWGKEEIDDKEALLGMDLVRLGLERAETAEGALDVLVGLLEKYGQGGNCMESQMSFTYHNSFLIADRKEAWILETAGLYWAAEKVEEGIKNISNNLSITTKIDREHPGMREYARTKGWWDGKREFNFAAVYSYFNPSRSSSSGDRFCEGYKLLRKHKGNITAESMMEILSDKPSGINMEGGFMTTGSMVSILPQDPSQPCCHFFTGTPDPSRSMFKPFIFVPQIEQFVRTASPVLGADDPVKLKPRFQTGPDRRHELYKKHESTLRSKETSQVKELLKKIKNLEKQKLEEVEILLQNGTNDTSALAALFSKCVEEEMKIYE